MIPRAAGRRRVVIVGARPGWARGGARGGERGHDVTLLEAMPWAGGQIRLAGAQPAPQGSAWASSTGASPNWRRLGVDVRVDTYADASTSSPLDPDVVIVATGGLPQTPGARSRRRSGRRRAGTSLGGDARPTRRRAALRRQRHPLGHVRGGDAGRAPAPTSRSSRRSACSASRSAASTIVPYARAFNETDTRITLNQRVLIRARDGDGPRRSRSAATTHRVATRVSSTWSSSITARSPTTSSTSSSRSFVNGGAVDHGRCWPGRPQPIVGDGYQLFRIGDAVAARNIHAAIYDALRICKDLSWLPAAEDDRRRHRHVRRHRSGDRG